MLRSVLQSRVFRIACSVVLLSGLGCEVYYWRQARVFDRRILDIEEQLAPYGNLSERIEHYKVVDNQIALVIELVANLKDASLCKSRIESWRRLLELGVDSPVQARFTDWVLGPEIAALRLGTRSAEALHEVLSALQERGYRVEPDSMRLLPLRPEDAFEFAWHIELGIDSAASPDSK